MKWINIRIRLMMVSNEWQFVENKSLFNRNFPIKILYYIIIKCHYKSLWIITKNISHIDVPNIIYFKTWYLAMVNNSLKWELVPLTPTETRFSKTKFGINIFYRTAFCFWYIHPYEKYKECQNRRKYKKGILLQNLLKIIIIFTTVLA